MITVHPERQVGENKEKHEINEKIIHFSFIPSFFVCFVFPFAFLRHDF
jgi:hypothetical protein